MRLFKSWHGLVAAGAISMMATPALATEPTSKEQQLEQRIAELEAQLENVVTQMQANSTSQTTLESRIAELQTTTTTAGDGGNGLSTYWNNGIRMDSADKNFKFKIGGRIQNDYSWFSTDSEADAFYGSDAFQAGAEFRRARLYMAGTIYGNVGFKAEYDFAGGDADFKDVYISLKDDCIGTITVGHHYEPFGLEMRTSSKYITFMERSLAAQMTPGRNTGISVSNQFDAGGRTWNWKGGIFRSADSFGDDSGNLGAGEYAVTTRLDGEVWRDDDNDELRMLAAGASFSYRNASDQLVDDTFAVPFNDEFSRVRLRGAQHLGGRLVDTGRFGVDDESKWYGLDVAGVWGPFHAQAEYIRQDWDVVGGSADLEGLGIQAGYFLTGETRDFSAKKGNWDRTSPGSNYGDEDGHGAWELAVRYDEADLADGLDGGDTSQWTYGLNWYLNPNTRVMWNYARIDAESGEINVFSVRFQIDF